MNNRTIIGKIHAAVIVQCHTKNNVALNENYASVCKCLCDTLAKLGINYVTIIKIFVRADISYYNLHS